jgi:hypothetical protein
MSIRLAVNRTNALVFILGASMLAHALPTPPQNSKDVNVVNTPNVNVANTPSVNVATMPAVTGSVAVTNTPTVNVGNTPSVSVSNTSAQPVPSVRIDEPGRIPYQSQVDKSASCISGTTCFFEFGSVPAGHRVVIQHVSGTVSFIGNPSAIWLLLNNGSGAPVSNFFAPQAPVVSFTAFDQTVQAYFDPAAFGGLIEVQVNLVGNSALPGGGSAQLITLSGYELDCNVAPCGPIAH